MLIFTFWCLVWRQSSVVGGMPPLDLVDMALEEWPDFWGQLEDFKCIFGCTLVPILLLGIHLSFCTLLNRVSLDWRLACIVRWRIMEVRAKWKPPWAGQLLSSILMDAGWENLGQLRIRVVMGNQYGSVLRAFSKPVGLWIAIERVLDCPFSCIWCLANIVAQPKSQSVGVFCGIFLSLEGISL